MKLRYTSLINYYKFLIKAFQNGDNSNEQFNDYLMSTTIGSLGLQATSCQKARVYQSNIIGDSDKTMIASSKVRFECASGYIAPKSFTIGISI
jgi:hypothetical protein